MARSHDDSDEEGDSSDQEGKGGDDGLEKYEFWRVFKAQVKMLRSEMGDGGGSAADRDDRVRLQSGPQVEATLPAPQGAGMGMGMDMGMGAGAGAGAAIETDGGPLGQVAGSSSAPASLPLHSFAPLARSKTPKLNAGVWEWGCR